MTWHWPMMWYWLMRCYDSVGLKFLCTVNRWRGSMLVDQKNRTYGTCIYTGLFSTKPRHYSNRVTIQTVLLFKPRGQTAYFWVMTWCNLEYSKCFLSDDHDLLNISIKIGPPPLIWKRWIYFLASFSVIPSPFCIFYVF